MSIFKNLSNLVLDKRKYICRLETLFLGTFFWVQTNQSKSGMHFIINCQFQTTQWCHLMKLVSTPTLYLSKSTFKRLSHDFTKKSILPRDDCISQSWLRSQKSKDKMSHWGKTKMIFLKKNSVLIPHCFALTCTCGSKYKLLLTFSCSRKLCVFSR